MRAVTEAKAFGQNVGAYAWRREKELDATTVMKPSCWGHL